MSKWTKVFHKAIFVGTTCMSLYGCGGAPGDSSGGTGGVAGETTLQIGSGGGSSFNNGVLSEELLSAGTSSASWTVSVVVANENNIAVTEEVAVTFTSTCVETGLASLDNLSVNTVAGRASVTYSSGSCTGIDTVVASLSSGASASVDLDIEANTSDSGGGTGSIDETVRIGNGSGSAYVDGILAVGSSSLQAGGTTNLSASLVDNDGEFVTQSITVTFTSSCVSDGIASFGQSSVASSAGQAVTSYTASGCVGDDIVTATANVNGEEVTATVTLNVTADTVSGLEFVSVSQSVLALPGTGGTETAEVQFRLIGELGAPVLGEAVSFDLTSSVGGVAIAPSRVSDISDENGLVSTLVRSGTVSTTFSVIATHDSSGNQTTSDGIVVSSGVPVDSKFSLSLSTFTPADAFGINGIDVGVSVIASDFFGNDVPDGSQVFFASPESGNIDSSCTLLSGQCSVTWISSGVRPSDLRATIIAYTNGAEDYTDVNGNTVFDGSDVAGSDLEEPFIDEDESGTYEPGEFFVDANSNGVRDGGNNLWDGPCLDAVNPVADCSGEDSILISETAIIRMPTNTPRLLSAVVSINGGANQVLENGDTIYTGSLGQAIVTAVVADDNLQADPFGGHPLPTATLIGFGLNLSGGGFDLSSNSVEVDLTDTTASTVKAFLTDSSEVSDTNVVMSLRVFLPNSSPIVLATFPVVFGDSP